MFGVNVKAGVRVGFSRAGVDGGLPGWTGLIESGVAELRD